jgi:TetR/AcrR family transcriptional regulator, transcriptional repressor for nem operon
LAAASRSAPAAERILDIAEQLAQTRGFNGFSYADIAAQLSVTKASLHYHFPAKADLGRALIVRYQVAFGAALDDIGAQSQSAREKLKRYVALYDNVMRNDRMCLCGMFAAEYATLPEQMQLELRRFFDANEVWLSGVMQEGRNAGELYFAEAPNERARVFVGALEGAMLIARSYKDDRRFRAVAQYLLSDLQAAVHGSKPMQATRRTRTGHLPVKKRTAST